MVKYGLTLPDSAWQTTDYDPSVDPTIAKKYAKLAYIFSLIIFWNSLSIQQEPV